MGVAIAFLTIWLSLLSIFSFLVWVGTIMYIDKKNKQRDLEMGEVSKSLSDITKILGNLTHKNI